MFGNQAIQVLITTVKGHINTDIRKYFRPNINESAIGRKELKS